MVGGSVRWSFVAQFDPLSSALLSTGNLYFANVLPADALEPGLLYLCAVFNRALRGLVQGDDQRIQPVSIPGTVLVSPAPRRRASRLAYAAAAVDKHWLSSTARSPIGLVIVVDVSGRLAMSSAIFGQQKLELK